MKKFLQAISWRDVGFLLIIFALVLVISMCESAGKIKAEFGGEILTVTSSKYEIVLDYDDIVAVDLTDMPDIGDEVDGSNNLSIVTGVWNNEKWGQYKQLTLVGITNCIVVTTRDGQTYVFNLKNNDETTSVYEQLLGYLSAE